MYDAIVKLSQNIDPITACFKSTELEHSYRQYYLRLDLLQVKIAITISVVGVMLFAYSDYQLFGNTPHLHWLLAIRGIMVTLSVITLIIIAVNKREHYLDAVIFIWVMALCSCEIYWAYNRPRDYSYSLAIDMALLVCIYGFSLNRFILQVVSAFYFSLLSIYLYISYKTHSPLSIRVVWVSFLFANLCGIWICWRFHIDRRTQFYLLIKERHLSEELKAAAEKIKTLGGLLPICASCKNIRDDEGYWHKVEVYIREHSDANFTHSICPDCFQKLYPEFVKDKKTET